MRRSNRDIQSSLGYMIAISIFIGSTTTLAFLAICSFLMTKVDFPDAIISIMSSVAICIGSYFASLSISKKRRRNGLAIGICCGLLIFLLLFFASIIFVKNPATGGFFSKFAMVMVSSIIGGIVGVNSKLRR